MYTTTISTDELATTLDDTGCVVVDCRSSLTDPEYGITSYRDGHIPGAIFASLDADLARHGEAHEGRHPLPDADAFIAWLERSGIGDDHQVVVYDDVSGAIAGRLWWMLSKWMGHAAVAVLDGGIKRWLAESRDLATDIPTRTTASFSGRPDDTAWITTDELVAALEAASATVIDARTAERYNGIEEPIDPVAGHIPGAVNLFLGGNLEKGAYLDDAALAERFSKTVQAAGGAQNIVHSCGSGVSALHNMLAMEKAGLSGSRLYVGSWSEWIRDPDRAIAKSG